jgi:hypothetical protein
MASEKQIAANQSNAQQSTGPRTIAGKRITRLNARTHGLSGQTILRTAEEETAYQVYNARLLPDLSPANNVELSFAERIVFDSWRLTRAAVMEQSLYALCDAEIEFDTGDPAQDDALTDARTFEVKEKTFNLLSLYSQRLQRSIHKDLDMLRKMQKERKAEAANAPAPAVKSVRPPAQIIEMSAPCVEIGSVCPTPPADPPPSLSEASNDPSNLAA